MVDLYLFQRSIPHLLMMLVDESLIRWKHIIYSGWVGFYVGGGGQPLWHCEGPGGLFSDPSLLWHCLAVVRPQGGGMEGSSRAPSRPTSKRKAAIAAAAAIVTHPRSSSVSPSSGQGLQGKGQVRAKTQKVTHDEGGNGDEESQRIVPPPVQGWLFLHALRSAVVRSPFMDDDDLYELSLVSKEVCDIVFDHVKSIGGKVRVLTMLDRFKGATELEVGNPFLSLAPATMSHLHNHTSGAIPGI